MKLRVEIIRAESTGDGIRVTAQGNWQGAAKWRAAEAHTFVVPATPTNLRAYHIGRIVTVTVEPT